MIDGRSWTRPGTFFITSIGQQVDKGVELNRLAENNTRSAEILKMSQSIGSRKFLGYDDSRGLIAFLLSRCAAEIRGKVGSGAFRFDVAERWRLSVSWRNGAIWTTG
jgi:hypothetical protein